ncbi:DUF805 domain-containing protein [Staphylococcus agnetis]|uniref:DUF805 domain-containing protein n=1 Tax=Staphylococcus agnetis TaxID=985762 RepID=UPI00117F2867|nr:DUF805 domain-containing protein [Staphylococcus agnetis]MBY7663410.1 DUF805 domain-containing protein [Staphylococcus agnetis]TRW83576.1 DUF805 domain-containing protein [Staphylococcus agnetis]
MIATPQVGFLEAFKLFWLNYINFKGRSRRSEYWWVMLWHIIILLPFNFLNGLASAISDELSYIILTIIILYYIVTFLPNLALTARRFHDYGFSMLVPIINIIVCILGYLNLIIVVSSMVGLIASSSSTFGVIALNFLILFIIASFGLQIFILVISVMDSKEEANKYGPSPKYVQYEAPYIAPKQGDITDNGNETEAARENINTTNEETPLKENHNMDNKKM